MMRIFVLLLIICLLAVHTGRVSAQGTTTVAPVTDAPSTDAPSTDAPVVTDAPATDAPATDAPATDAPATDAPATDAPATDAPATDAPSTNAPAVNAEDNDLVALNYALTLEHLEAAFYAQGQSQFDAAAFIAAGLTQTDYDRFTLIAAHEKAHVDALVSTINNRGGKAVEACTYDFKLTDVASYLATAQTLENTGVSAYDGAITAITDSGLQQVAATIATVEARHAAYLNALNKASPFPAALDTAVAPSDILSAAGPFITACPTAPVAPVVRPGAVKYTTDSVPPPAPVPVGTYSNEQLLNDNVALNYALTLENLEAAFYNQGLAKFKAADFSAAGYDASVYDNFGLIQAHENAHVQALQQIISSRTGTPVNACEYNFTLAFESVDSFVATAKLLENTGVSAYDGAVNTISDIGLQQAAATIATVEARHASFLNNVTGGAGFPDNFDTALSPNDVLAAAGPFFTECDYTPVGPVVIEPSNNGGNDGGDDGGNGQPNSASAQVGAWMCAIPAFVMMFASVILN